MPTPLHHYADLDHITLKRIEAKISELRIVKKYSPKEIKTYIERRHNVQVPLSKVKEICDKAEAVKNVAITGLDGTELPVAFKVVEALPIDGKMIECIGKARMYAITNVLELVEREKKKIESVGYDNVEVEQKEFYMNANKTLFQMTHEVLKSIEEERRAGNVNETIVGLYKDIVKESFDIVKKGLDAVKENQVVEIIDVTCDKGDK